jgi:hypothetical protein
MLQPLLFFLIPFYDINLIDLRRNMLAGAWETCTFFTSLDNDIRMSRRPADEAQRGVHSSRACFNTWRGVTDPLLHVLPRGRTMACTHQRGRRENLGWWISFSIELFYVVQATSRPVVAIRPLTDILSLVFFCGL